MSAYRICLAVGLIGLAVGCEGDDRPTPVPVRGKVMYKKSTPAAGALVVFHPTDDADESAMGGKPFATVGDDGTFELTTREAGDGAPAGEYGVTIDWRASPQGKAKGLSLTDEGAVGRSRLNPKYSNPQKPAFTVTVTPDGPNEFTFEAD